MSLKLLSKFSSTSFSQQEQLGPVFLILPKHDHVGTQMRFTCYEANILIIIPRLEMDNCFLRPNHLYAKKIKELTSKSEELTSIQMLKNSLYLLFYVLVQQKSMGQHRNTCIKPVEHMNTFTNLLRFLNRMHMIEVLVIHIKLNASLSFGNTVSCRSIPCCFYHCIKQ